MTFLPWRAWALLQFSRARAGVFGRSDKRQMSSTLRVIPRGAKGEAGGRAQHYLHLLLSCALPAGPTPHWTNRGPALVTCTPLSLLTGGLLTRRWLTHPTAGLACEAHGMQHSAISVGSQARADTGSRDPCRRTTVAGPGRGLHAVDLEPSGHCSALVPSRRLHFQQQRHTA